MAVTVTHFHRWRPAVGFHRLCCGFMAKTTLDIRTHILSSLRCDLGKMYFKRFIVLTFHSSLLSSAVTWASLWVFLTRGHLFRHHMRGRHYSPDSVESDYDHTLCSAGHTFGCCMRAVIIRRFMTPGCALIAGGRSGQKPSFPGPRTYLKRRSQPPFLS
jgi:hypothetical protein